MKFFLFFLIACLAGGMLMPKASPARLAWALAGLSTFMLIGYFFLNQI
jgi:hypothetical protein